MANEILDIVIKKNNAIKSDRARRTAVNTVFSLHRRRIFEEGLDANGGKIGTYSTVPTRISKSKQARNTGQTFFPGGYAEYKSMVGKNPGFIILRNFDEMYMDYGVIQNGSSLALGFQNNINYKKARWNEERKGKTIFAHDKREIDLLMEVLMFELNK